VDEPRSVVAVIISAGLSAIPGVGGPIQTFFDYAVEQQRKRVRSTALEVVEAVGEAALLGRVQENPELESLLVQALEAASRTGHEAKRKLLGKAAAQALMSDDAIDPAVLVVHALSQLEPVHIRALARLVGFSDSLGPWPEEDTTEFHERTKEMVIYGEEQIALPILVALVNTGVVMQTTNAFGGGTHLHDVSAFGRDLLRGLSGGG
jgi:hypothetical protein